MLKKTSSIILVICLIVITAAGCSTPARVSKKPAVIKSNLPKLNMKKWKYSKENDLYYQVGIEYCEKPVNKRYEKLAVFVPASYMKATKNSKNTYSCKLNKNAEIKGYNSSNAPIVMPIETPEYISHTAMTNSLLENYKSILGLVANYTSQGFIFVDAGCRGNDEGAPAGVTDLKAAVRYLRYCDDEIAGDAESIFVYGVSGGGAQSTILGASGDSKLYEPYLKKIGAVQGVSDAVAGSMSWCPITSLNTANAEYEWMMGLTRKWLTEKEKAISDSLAKAYAGYVNKAGFVDENGNVLTLEESKEGIYQAGSYYDYIKSVIERSLNNFLSDADFSDSPAEEYIDDLNAKKKWVDYDKSTNTAKITSVSDFAKAFKNASRYPFAFDQPEYDNPLFGINGKGVHFDKILADVLTEHKSKYASAYNADFKKLDSFGYSVEKRLNMYSPLYYILKSEKGYSSSKVSKYWRIRSGIEQTNTSVTTEVNLALALNNCEGVKSVDFETIWAQGHTQAERKGNDIDNLINWVNKCMK